MELYLRNDDGRRIAIIPEYESLVWKTSLMTSTADLKASISSFEDIAEATYIERSDSDTWLFINRKSITDRVGERGAYLSAYDPVELMRRRVLFWTHHFQQSSTVGMRREEVITLLVAQATTSRQEVSPDSRAIPLMSALINTGATSTHLNARITQQMSWGNIYERIEGVLEGLPIRFFSRRETGQARPLRPTLYEGRNLTRSVVVSTEHGDLFDVEYSFESVDRNTLAVVAGQGEGSSRLVTVARDPSLSPLYGELWVDANDIGDDDGEIQQHQVIAALQSRGLEKLVEQPCEHALTASISQDRYQYREDYQVGDRISYEAFGVRHSDIVSEVEEVFEGQNTKVNITIGNAYPSIRKIIDRSRL